MWIRILLLAACLTLSACAAVSGYPQPVFSQKEEDAELAPYLKASAIENYATCADKVACRNEIIDARVRAVDLAFHRFQRKIHSQESKVSLGSDLAAMSLDAAAALTGTKILAAGAGVLTGSRDAYEKQVLSVSTSVLFSEMIANRSEILYRIRKGETLPVAAYTLFQGLDDISEYEQAGSIPAAATQLTSLAGSKSKAAQDSLDALRASQMASAMAAAATPPSSGPSTIVTSPAPSTAAPTSMPSYTPPVTNGTTNAGGAISPTLPSTPPAARLPTTSPPVTTG